MIAVPHLLGTPSIDIVLGKQILAAALDEAEMSFPVDGGTLSSFDVHIQSWPLREGVDQLVFTSHSARGLFFVCLVSETSNFANVVVKILNQTLEILHAADFIQRLDDQSPQHRIFATN